MGYCNDDLIVALTLYVRHARMQSRSYIVPFPSHVVTSVFFPFSHGFIFTFHITHVHTYILWESGYTQCGITNIMLLWG